MSRITVPPGAGCSGRCCVSANQRASKHAPTPSWDRAVLRLASNVGPRAQRVPVAAKSRPASAAPRRRKGMLRNERDARHSGQDERRWLRDWLLLAPGAATYSSLAADFSGEKLELMLVGHLIFVRMLVLLVPGRGRRDIERPSWGPGIRRLRRLNGRAPHRCRAGQEIQSSRSSFEQGERKCQQFVGSTVRVRADLGRPRV